MIDRLWLDRRVIFDMVLSTGRRPGDLVVSMLPGLRWFKRKLRGHGRQEDYNSSSRILTEEKTS